MVCSYKLACEALGKCITAIENGDVSERERRGGQLQACSLVRYPVPLSLCPPHFTCSMPTLLCAGGWGVGRM